MGDIGNYITSFLATAKQNEYGIAEYVLAIVFSMAIGVICMMLYRAYYSSDYERNDSLAKSFVVIAPAVTAVFYAIQYSLPLSLGLLGALSFVRFRTPIKKPEDIGFILLIIALSLLTAVFRFMAAGILLFIVTGYVFWKIFFIEKQNGIFRQGEFITAFVSTESLDLNSLDGNIKSVLLNEFGQKTSDKSILDDVTKNNELYNMRYLLYLNKAEEQSLTRLMTSLNGIEQIKDVEVFRGRAV